MWLPASSRSLRSDVQLASLNAGLWAIGAGLAPTLVVLYFALGLGGQGMTVSWVLAAPRFAGLLRLATPALIDRLGSRKRLCVLAYSLSAVCWPRYRWSVWPPSGTPSLGRWPLWCCAGRCTKS